MNQKEIAEWIEDRGELMLMKKDGEGFVIAARAPDGMWNWARRQYGISVCSAPPSPSSLGRVPRNC